MDLIDLFIGTYYQAIGNRVVEIADANEEKHIRELLDSIYQRVKGFFVLSYDNAAGNNQVSHDSFKKYFLPRVKNWKLKHQNW